MQMPFLETKLPLIIIDEIREEELQEKLTDIINKDKFVLITAYELLKLKLPEKDIISRSTSKIETGSDTAGGVRGADHRQPGPCIYGPSCGSG